jgi:hypothetical protein
MHAYNPTHVQNRAIRQQADRWQREGLLSAEQRTAIQQAHPVPFRDSNTFAEIGSFIFTAIAVGGAYALLMLFLLNLIDNSPAWGVFNALVSLGLLALARNLISQANFYRNGPDNALIVLGVAFLIAAINMWLPSDTAFWLRCLLAVPFLLLSVLYYGDVTIAFLTLLTFYVGLFSGMLEFPWGRAALPFVLMAVSLGVHLLFRSIKTRLAEQLYVYYVDVLTLSEWATLVVLAAAGNYFVVRELNGLLMEVPPGEPQPEAAPQIALPGLFWVLTVLIPALYAYLGLTRKSRMLVVLALLGLAAAASTVRFYHPLLPLSIHLTLVGAALIAAAVFAIHYLQKPRFGFTDVADEDSPRQFFLNAETLSAISATGAPLNRTPDMKFGGGNFGGGGAGREY